MQDGAAGQRRRRRAWVASDGGFGAGKGSTAGAGDSSFSRMRRSERMRGDSGKRSLAMMSRSVRTSTSRSASVRSSGAILGSMSES